MKTYTYLELETIIQAEINKLLKVNADRIVLAASNPETPEAQLRYLSGMHFGAATFAKELATELESREEI